MEIHTIYTDSVTMALPYDNISFSKAEDSGYHTFTPSSIDCVEISNECIEPIIANRFNSDPIKNDFHYITPEVNIHLNRRYNHSTAFNDSALGTPPLRRGLKRPYSSTDNDDIFNNSIPTPTSFIAGKIKSLHVKDNKENLASPSPISSRYSDNFNPNLYKHNDFEHILSYPTTPVKKNCIRSPCRRSAKQLNFTIHSLSCETNGLQTSSKLRVPSKAVRNILFKREPKVDLITKLYYEAHAVPPVMKVLSYLSNEDIQKFGSVSKDWLNIWESISDSNKKKKEYKEFLKTAKENQENRDKGTTPKINSTKPVRSLKEIQNEINAARVPCPAPPTSPRTNRFRKFTKCASLDSRMQLACARCCQPAKVTKEASGEEWMECTSQSCLYQSCKYCKCERHPTRPCFKYDLTVPSPSKKKKTQYAIGTNKSRKNLRRLL